MTEEAQESTSERSWRLDDWLGFVILCAAALCAAIWLLDLGRGLTFYFDEWDFIEAAATSGYWHNVLQPHNGHPSMIPFTVYEVLLHTVGLRHYWPYQLLLVLLDIGCGWLLFLLLRRKVHPLVAGAASAALMLLGPAWQDLLWPFQIGFLGSVAGGLGALVFLDRGTRRADVGACICLVASVACSGVGLPFVVGVIVELAWRRQSWRRAWIPAIPLGLFVVWYEAIGKSTTSSISPGSVVRSIGSDTATTVGALVGRGSTVGSVLTGVLAAAIIAVVARSPGRAARLAMATSGLLAFWLLTLLARGVSQDSASRYLYPASALVLVAVGEIPTLITRKQRARHAVGMPAWTSRVGTIAALAVVAFAAVAIWWNAATLTNGAAGLKGVSARVATELRAVTLAQPALPVTFQPDGTLMPQVTVGPYLRSVAAFGSPVGSLADATNPLGASVDAMLLRGRPMEVSPVSNPDADQTNDKRCVRSPISPSGQAVTFTLPQHGALVRAPPGAALDVRVKSFAEAFPDQALAVVGAGSTSRLRWSAKTSSIRWTVELTPARSPAPAGSVATVCSAS